MNIVYKTLMVKLLPDKQQQEALIDTFVKFNEACNFVSRLAFDRKLYNKVLLQKIVYKDIRENYGLAAQLAIRVIAKVVETYKADKTVMHEFREYGSIVYDQRVMSFKSLDTVSLNTVRGRIRIPMTIGKYRELPLDRVRGQCDLVRRNRIFYLMVVVEVPEGEAIETEDVIGVDLGIENIAVDSSGHYYSGDRIAEARTRHSNLRSRLQACGTRSAKRHLKKLSGKERRFARDVNHVISNEIVERAKGASSAIALEERRGIRMRATVGKNRRYAHNSWSFRQLRNFIEYKALESGIPVVAVDPRNSSRECPACHTIDKRNRPERSSFKCVSCDFEGEADFVASLNIRNRAAVNQPIVAGAIYDQSLIPQLQATSVRVG